MKPNEASKPSVAYSEKAVVPIFLGQPRLEADFRIRCRSKHSHDATEGGQFMERLVDTRPLQIARSDGFCHGDGCVRKLQVLNRRAAVGMEHRGRKGQCEKTGENDSGLCHAGKSTPDEY